MDFPKEEKQRLRLDTMAGNLCALNLDTFEWIAQRNID